MGVSKIADTGKDHVIDWRNSRRLGHIRFGNVRTMSPEVSRMTLGFSHTVTLE